MPHFLREAWWLGRHDSERRGTQQGLCRDEIALQGCGAALCQCGRGGWQRNWSWGWAGLGSQLCCLTSCVTPGKSLHLFELQFSHLKAIVGKVNEINRSAPQCLLDSKCSINSNYYGWFLLLSLYQEKAACWSWRECAPDSVVGALSMHLNSGWALVFGSQSQLQGLGSWGFGFLLPFHMGPV